MHKTDIVKTKWEKNKSADILYEKLWMKWPQRKVKHTTKRKQWWSSSARLRKQNSIIIFWVNWFMNTSSQLCHNLRINKYPENQHFEYTFPPLPEIQMTRYHPIVPAKKLVIFYDKRWRVASVINPF